jgi:hypothetical protein
MIGLGRINEDIDPITGNQVTKENLDFEKVFDDDLLFSIPALSSIEYNFIFESDFDLNLELTRWK